MEQIVAKNMSFKKGWYWLLIFFTAGLLIVHWLDNSVSNVMENSWKHGILMEEIEGERVVSIWRQNKDNTIYGFDFQGSIGRNYCFEYGKGFDEYLQVGDLIYKKK